jgi:hypothetical protein
MLREPLQIEGFYATRVLARRAFRFVVFASLVAIGLTLAMAAIAAAVFDLLMIGWGLS